MDLDKLRKIIELNGLRSGFDTETNNLIIMSNGFMKLGEIDVSKQFDVDFNKHFQRQVSREAEISIYKAVFEFVEAPLTEREAAK